MRKFKSFILRPFINQHGSHAKKPQVKRMGIVNQHGSHAKIPPRKIDEETKKGIISSWHDGTPEGKRQHDQLMEHFHSHGGEMEAMVPRYDHHTSPYSKVVHAHIDVKGGYGRPSELHDHLVKHHDYSNVQTHPFVEYTTMSYGINRALVHDKSISHQTHHIIQGLDHGIASAKHGIDNVTTFHGTGYNIADHLKHSPIIHNKGFTSSSVHPSIANRFTDPTSSNRNMLIINGMKYHRPMPMSRELSPGNHSELEVLHPRGLQLRPRARVSVDSRDRDGWDKPAHYWSTDIIGINPHKYQTHDSYATSDGSKFPEENK